MKRILFLLICLPVLGWSQSVIVSGNVSDNIDIVPGVNVIEKGTTNGTTTDFNGNYEISVASNKSILVFSYVGYASQEITVTKQRTLNIKLIEDAQALDAVVVRGFTGVLGKARKRTESIQNIPESVTAFNSQGIENSGINNVTEFAKQVPNLKLSSTQAAGINFITVRGISQIRNADAPVAFVIAVSYTHLTLPTSDLV